MRNAQETALRGRATSFIFVQCAARIRGEIQIKPTVTVT